MDLQAEIKWLKAELDKVKDPSFIHVIKSLFRYRNGQLENDWWDEISEEEKGEIEEGIRQADKGDVISHAQMKDKHKKWL
ncbi:MAG: hypothetical protein KDD36_09445 [Flavobacteriales bacterium]|nr:hypothetical protein [Flavobacteriales bacterium]